MSKDVIKKEYDDLLKSGMFWEFYPDLTGNYKLDEAHWLIHYSKLLESRDIIEF